MVLYEHLFEGCFSQDFGCLSDIYDYMWAFVICKSKKKEHIHLEFWLLTYTVIYLYMYSNNFDSLRYIVIYESEYSMNLYV